MFKYFLLISATTIFLSAVEVDIKADKKIIVDADETGTLINMGQSENIQIDKKDAKRLIEENRKIADLFLLEAHLPQPYLTSLRLNVEKQLANMMTKQYSEKFELSDEVLRSYYLAEKDKFYKEKQIQIEVLKFSDFETALQAYRACEKSPESSGAYAEKQGIEVIKQSVDVHNLHVQLKSQLRENDESNYLLPPQVWGDGFIVVRIAGYIQKGYRPYDTVKDEIREKLVVENDRNARKALLKEYSEKFGSKQETGK